MAGMARNVVFGFIIKGKDSTGKAWSGLKSGGIGALRGVKAAADRTKASIELVSQATTGLNAGLEVIKKGVDVGRLVIENTVVKALEQRGLFDGQLKDMKRYGALIEKLQGLIGDLLIPVILGIADAMKPTLKAWESYLETNKQVVGSGVISWLQDTAKTLVDKVATGVILATKAWSGLKLAVDFVQLAAQEAFQVILSGVDVAAQGFAALMRALGKDELAAQIEATRKVTASLRVESENTADVLLANMAREVAAQEKLEESVRSFEAAAVRGIDRAAVAAFKRLGQEVKKIPPGLEAIERKSRALWDAAVLDRYAASVEEAYQKALAAEMATADRIIANEVNTLGDLKAAWARYLAERDTMGREAQRKVEQWLTESTESVSRTMAEDLRAQLETVASAIRETFNEAFSDIGRLQTETVTEIVRNEEGMLEEQERIVGQHIKGLDDAFGAFFGGLAKRALMAAEEFVIAKSIEMAATRASALLGLSAAAAEGQASAIAAHAGIPFVGLAVGLAAAAAIGAAIYGLQKFHTGGMIPGSGETPIMALGGEYVAERAYAPEAAAYVEGLKAGGGGAGGGGGAQGGGSGGGAQFNATFAVYNLAPADRAETERQLSVVLPDIIQGWIDDGRIRLRAA